MAEPAVLLAQKITIMFRRQSRDPFPVRNIAALSFIVLLVLVFVLQQLKKTEQAPAPALLIEPDTTESVR